MQKRKLGSITYAVVRFSVPSALPKPFVLEAKRESYPTVKTKQRSKAAS